ncbi:hypothetical protein ABZO31_18545 [Streptomyces sp. HUAS MG47]|uniref:hypothetical protein n=1 Tax=Streptomyces solicamelliae TaxID=3231716 RepID=UPI003877BB26
MPRGRHRHSPPLHKLLPPSAVAGASAVCAVGAWLFADPLVLRLLVAAAAAAAVTGSVLMRSWDRSAGRKVAELGRARTADQWKAEERIAELESDLEESRELRVRLETKLRAKRVELAGLRNEHAELLRRYATAETARASALEGTRRLALEASAPAKELPVAGAVPAPEAYRKAAEALRNLARNAAAQEARRTAEAARSRDLAERAREEEPQGKHAAAAGTGQHARTAAALPAVPAAPAVRTVPAAAAVVPYHARRPAPRPEGGFDFFGTQVAGEAAKALQPGQTAKELQAGQTAKELQSGQQKAVAAIEAVQHEDLADVVGEEVLAGAAVPRPVPGRAIGQVIDLTAHDETEQLDVAELRGAVNS